MVLPVSYIGVSASSSTTVAVEPSTISVNPGQFFTINVTITSVTDLTSFGFRVKFPRGLLEVEKDNITEGSFLAQGGTTSFTAKVSSNYIDVGCVLLAATGVSGSGILASAIFKVRTPGNTTLDLYYVSLLSGAQVIDDWNKKDSPSDGYFYTTLPVARYSYKPHPTNYPGHPIVNETVTFNATESYDPDDTHDSSPGGIVTYSWDFGDNSTGTGLFANHTYGAPGSYVVTLNITDDDGELSAIDHPIIGTTVSVQFHDVAVINVKVAPSEVSLGGEFAINVTVLNRGSDTETLNVTAYASINQSWLLHPVETQLFEYWEVGPPPFYVPQQYTSLESDKNATTTITWDTTGVPAGMYVISVRAFLVKLKGGRWESAPDLESEENMLDNGRFYGNVTILGAARHDLAITNLKISPTSLKINEWVNIEVAVENEGTMEEHFNASLTIEYGSEVTVLKPLAWSNQTSSAGATVRLEHRWLKGNETTKEGTYNITARVQLVNKTTLEPPSYEDANPVDNVLGKEVELYLRPVPSFAYSPTEPSVDGTVFLNATESYNPGVPEGTIEKYSWNFGDGTRVEKTSPAATHVYRLNGTYTVELTVTDDSGQEDSVKRIVTVSSDMAHILMNITFSPSVAMPGQSVSANVTVRNAGYLGETFNVTAYYDENEIGSEKDITLESGAKVSLTFTWDTTGVPHGYYRIQTVASKEGGLHENTCVGGTVVIGMGGIGPGPTGNIVISTSPSSLHIGASTTISGSISPVSAGARVMIYFRPREAETWSNLSMVITDQDGEYAYTWEPRKIGLYALKSVLLSEDATLMGESEVEVMVVEESTPPLFLYATVGLAAAAGLASVIMAVVVFFLVKAGTGKRG